MKRFIVGFIPLSFMVGLPAIAGRMACVLAAVLLLCASSAHAQVIEEGGFPVKGGGVSSESFSLSCPPRLAAQAGGSVLFSCSVTAAPEEGVRYEWESLSGGGLRLLSDAQALDPLFTSPLSEAGEEYAYRLTAMSVGVYETATVTVSVERVPEETVSVPVVREECDSLVDFEGGREGCVPWEKAPPRDPFGGIPEDEGIVPWPSFPESPGAEEKEFPGSSGGGSFPRTPPRLECPVAVFLEELETGQVECHAWDASGEEYLEYSWEPVGSTTRDYLDNPRLIPEDSPTPSVIAPETPVYETLESFHSGETTFLYRYRLTATSRATGLSSSSEVEVYVSSSRPGVYCPLEVVVEEGETVQLDCEGADPLSARMDYDEEAASVLWEWEGLWATSMAPLAGADLSSPLFTAPLGSAGEEYHYIASMTTSASGVPRTARRKVTVRVAGEEDASGRTNNFSLTIPGSPFTVTEWERNVAFRYHVRHPAGTSTAIGIETVDSAPDVLKAWDRAGETAITFNYFAIWNNISDQAPCVDKDTIWEYKVCLVEPPGHLVSSCSEEALSEDAIADLSITILDSDNPACFPRNASVACSDRVVSEGADDFALRCSPTNEPSGATYSWTGTDIDDRLTDTDGLRPTFDVPEDLDRDANYYYTISMSVDGYERATDDLRILVRDIDSIGISCAAPAPVYEGADDFVLDCSETSRQAGVSYSWSEIGNTSDTERLSSTTELRPTFLVPENVDSDTDYEYRVRLVFRAGNSIISRSADVTVTVKDKPDITVTCEDSSYDVDEGDSDIELRCDATGGPDGSTYRWRWSPTDRLTDHDTATPVFAVPASVGSDTNYRYRVTATAENAEAGVADVIVRVRDTDLPVPVVSCNDSEVYEGSADFDLRCTVRNEPSNASYRWSGTDVADRLTDTDGLTPTFLVPDDVDSDTDYEYAVTLSGSGVASVEAAVTVTVLNKGALAVACAAPGTAYEGSEDIAFDCEASGAPVGSDYTYAWTTRGDTGDTSLLSATDIASPVFHVLAAVDATTTYEYLLTASAANAEDATAEVAVTVLNRGPLSVVCTYPGSVYEGSEDIAFDCSASGAPGDDPQYTYAWTARGDTQDTSLLSAADIASPTFHVPDEVDRATTYEYLLTASADNAEDGAAEVAVTVLNRGPLSVVCTYPGSVYEGSEDIAFDCSASGAPGDDPQYTYAWTARGDTQDTSLLSAADIASPTFHVPDEVDRATTYEYLLTASADNAEDGAAEVAVTVLNRGPLSVVCTYPGSVYEGSEDIAFDCSASGAPGDDPQYTYAWTPLGDTQDTSLLSAVDIASPTFLVPEEANETMTYEYLLTASADNAEDATAEVTVTVLNKEPLAVRCADPGSVYEGSADIAFDCSASDAPGDSPEYTYVWTARGDTQDTSLLSAVDIASPTFHVPEEVNATMTYEYLLTASADNAEDGAAEVTVTVLNKEPLAVRCADPGSVYEGSADFDLDCSASDAPGDSPEYTYVWTPLGDTQDTSLLSAADTASPTFHVPDEVDRETTYEYLLTASADNAEDATAEVTVTVLNKEPLAARCADPGSVYEGSPDIAFDCSASDAPGDSPEYTYVWTPLGDTQDTSLLSATDIASPTFYVPDEVDENETYEYLLTASAENAEDATAGVTVTVLDRAQTPPSDPVSPPVAFSSAREPSEPSALGVTISASSLRFGVQSADTQVSLDPMTDGISTHVSGLYHAGRMTLAPGGSEALDENGEMDLSIELALPVVLRREGAIEAASIILAPQWSLAESCEQLSSQAIGGLYTEVTLSEDTCRLLRFGGELDLTDVPSGQYTGSMDIILRSGEREETHSVEVDVTVVPAQQVITIGPRGVRFSTSRELPAGLTEEQNLSIYPHVAFLTEEKPHGVFELSNPSLIPLEVSVSARFGYTEATENGREVVVEDASGSHLGDLSEVVDIHPGVLVLMPGEKGLIRYGVKEGALAAMAQKGYAAFFDVVSEPRQYIRSDQMPEEVTGEKTARVTMRVPGVYVPGEGASQLRATLSSISYMGSLSATFLVETADHPFVGEVVAYDGDGRELGRRETLVYTRSRVRVPLDRTPEEGAVFLRFMPRGSDRVPEPASVEWDAPRRDIGDAGNKDGATTTATLAGKP